MSRNDKRIYNNNKIQDKPKTIKNKIKQKKNFLCLILFVFVFGLTGCVPKISEPRFVFKESEKNAESAREVFLKANQNKKNLENYHANLKMEAIVYMPTFLNLNIKTSLQLKSAINSGKKSAHETGRVKGRILGMYKNSDHEMYYDNQEEKGYFREKEDKIWKEIHTKNPMEILMDYGTIASFIPDNTQFKEKRGTYIVTISAKDINILEIISAVNPSVGKIIGNADIKDGALIYEFDKETMFLEEISLSGLELREKFSGRNCKITMDGNILFSQFNKIAAEKYHIPEKLIKTN